MADTTASIPFMATNAQRQQLISLGYSEKQIDGMKPEEIHGRCNAINGQSNGRATAAQVAAIKIGPDGKPDAECKVAAAIDCKTTKPRPAVSAWLRGLAVGIAIARGRGRGKPIPVNPNQDHE
jgi:hypothetical protein